MGLTSLRQLRQSLTSSRQLRQRLTKFFGHYLRNANPKKLSGHPGVKHSVTWPQRSAIKIAKRNALVNVIARGQEDWQVDKLRLGNGWCEERRTFGALGSQPCRHRKEDE